MGKRSSFERRDRDAYDTPAEAVAPLLAHLSPRTQFIEPCAGSGALIGHLESVGHLCRAAFDIEPRRDLLAQGDALEWSRPAGIPYGAFTIITNPPWSRDVLHPLIERLSDAHPTWLLFDADWIHTRQAVPFMPRLRRIVSVGRVKWIADSPFTGKDNCAWHLFTKPSHEAPAFYARAA
jgi:hypothetical protein